MPSSSTVSSGIPWQIISLMLVQQLVDAVVHVVIQSRGGYIDGGWIDGRITIEGPAGGGGGTQVVIWFAVCVCTANHPCQRRTENYDIYGKNGKTETSGTTLTKTIEATTATMMTKTTGLVGGGNAPLGKPVVVQRRRVCSSRHRCLVAHAIDVVCRGPHLYRLAGQVQDLPECRSRKTDRWKNIGQRKQRTSGPAKHPSGSLASTRTGKFPSGLYAKVRGLKGGRLVPRLTTSFFRLFPQKVQQ